MSDEDAITLEISGEELEEAKALVEFLVKSIGWKMAYIRFKTCVGLMEQAS